MYAPVAQLDRVLGFEPKGRTFESCRAYQELKHKRAIVSHMRRPNRILTALLFFALSTLAPVFFHASAGAANVNNFIIDDYTIDYHLSKGSDGRSELKTVESITADFSIENQNHGIERAIPKKYDNHSTSLKIKSVTDETGRAIHYTTYTSNDNLVVRIGQADTYVLGVKHYVITYTQRDVTRYFADTNDDEFYWDTDGTQWAVPIAHLVVNFHTDPSLSGNLTGNKKCYVGYTGSNNMCQINQTSDGFAAEEGELDPGKNVTIAVGFQPHTFGTYKASLIDRLQIAWFISLAITLFIALPISGWFYSRYYAQSESTSEKRSVIPEYTPPKDTSVSVAATIYKSSRNVFSAQLIDLAVRGYLKIYETRPKSFLRKAQYDIEIVNDTSTLKTEELEILTDIFPNVTVGSRLSLQDLKKRRTTIATNLSDNSRKIDNDIHGKYGLRARIPTQIVWFKRASLYSFIAGVLLVSPWFLFPFLVAFFVLCHCML